MSGAPTGGLAILVDAQRVNDLLTQKSGAKAVLRSACNTVLFMCFLSLFTALALGEPRETKRAFEGFVRRRFDTAATIKLADVASVKDFWRFHNESFMPGIYGADVEKYSYPGAVVARMLPIQGANRLYGIARMRAVAILPDMNCLIADQFKADFPSCYGPFHIDAIDRSEFGPLNEDGQAMFSFFADPVGEKYNGKLATYPPGGYAEPLTSDYLTTSRKMREMEVSGFINEKTRVIFLDFCIYNFNLGLYAVCRIVFEIAPGGDWTNTFDVDILLQRHLTALGSGTTFDWIILIAEAVLVLFVLRYLLEEASEFVSFETKGGRTQPSIKWDYFLDGWNVLDWANLLMMIVTLTIRIQTWSVAGDLTVFVGNPKDVTVDKYADLHRVASNVRRIHSLVCFNTVLTWFKAVKYLTIVPYITTFMQTVTISQQMLGSWVVVFTSSLIGFVLAFSTAFGGEVSILRTPWKSWVYIMQTVVGNSEMKVIYDVSPLLGSVLIVFFVVGIFFVIMNLFYAIMVSTLSEAKAEEDAKHKKKIAQLLDRLLDLWSMLKTQFRLDQRFRSSFPGLYSRIMKRKKKQEMKEKAREENMIYKIKARAPDALQMLGPGSPQWGRRQKRNLATVAQEEELVQSDSEGSEDDLGPLRSIEQIKDKAKVMEKTFGSTGSMAMLKDKDDDLGPTTDEGIDLVMDATRHIATGIIERCSGSRNVLLAEMGESMEVLNNVATVLEVLGKRARDLEAQQKQVLKNL